MEKSYKSQSTEKIKGEDWCAECRQPVEQWNVFFEESIHTDTGYDKVRRCPHCSAKCFEDGSFEVGCFFFFVGLFGLPILLASVLTRFGIKFDLDDEGDAWIYLILSFAGGALLSATVCWVWKQWLYRQREPKDDVDR